MARKPGFHVSVAVILMMFLVTACSGGSDPVTGSVTGGDQGLTAPRSAVTANSRVLWGYWNVVIDTETSSVEVVPKRGVMMHVNAVEWMQPPAGDLSNLQVVIVNDMWLTEGRFDLDVTLKHPFPGADTYTGFDVMGVFMTDGHRYPLAQPGVTLSDGGNLDATMLNSDGYTRWWNQDEFEYAGVGPTIFHYIPGKLGFDADGLDAKFNPYKYFTDGLLAEDDEGEYLAANPGMRGMFGAGAENTRRYELKWPMVGSPPQAQLAFDYAVVASWEPPTPSPPINVPDDFPITANALEPVAISVTDNSEIYYVSDIVKGGYLDLDLEIYDWQGLIPGQPIPDTISRVVIEILSSPSFPDEAPYVYTSATWTVGPGGVNSSVWEVDIPGLVPSAAGPQSVLAVFETVYNYDNGYGTTYPPGPLSSYFMIEGVVLDYDPSIDLPPQCEDPVAEFTERNVLDIEEFTANVWEPQSEPFNIDWSVEPFGNPPQWVNIDSETIIVNWWAATNNGSVPGDYDVCVSVYNGDGWNMCCTVPPVMVAPAPTLGLVPGQGDLTPPQQPDQGAEPCDITLWDTGSGSHGQLMYQDSGLVEVRLYRFNDDYSSIVGLATLNNDPPPGGVYPPPLNDATYFNDWHKFDVRPSGGSIQTASASDLRPSIADPNTYNINDPCHAFILPYANMSGNLQMMALYGDVGYSPTPPSPPDPDSVPWKHMVDWTAGAAHYASRMYGLMTISEHWIPDHPGYTHPGTIWAIYSVPPYNDFITDYDDIDLGGLSTQDPGGGEVNDEDPGLMALGLDDEMPVEADWSSTPDALLSDIVVWYMLSSEPTGADRKVHIVLLPEDITIPFDIYYYENFIGNGSSWGVDFGGATPVDIETVYANKVGSGLAHTFNWLAVLLDTGGNWRVDVFRYDPLFGNLDLVRSHVNAGVSGTPNALDIDTEEHEIHVLYDDGVDYRVTVLEFTP